MKTRIVLTSAVRLLIIASAAVALTSCWAEVGGHAIVSGTVVQNFLNEKFRGPLLAQFPGTRVGASSCPAVLAVSETEQTLCTLTVDGQQYPLRVSWDARTNRIRALAVRALVQRNQVVATIPVRCAALVQPFACCRSVLDSHASLQAVTIPELR